MDKPRCIALLLAGGQGQRMHSDRPKQFIEVEGMPVIYYTMRAFERHADIDGIHVVCTPEWEQFVCDTATRGAISKFGGTFPAGDTSIASLRNGVEGLLGQVGGGKTAVMTHEAVRPLVDEAVISHNLEVFRAHGNAVTAVRSNEAYMVSRNGAFSESCIPRELLYRAQTPITFPLSELAAIFGEAESRHIDRSQSLYTLVAGLFPEKKLYIAQGTEQNFKLTFPEDIEKLEAILAYRKQKRH